ncbi:MAG: DUF4405 domain-containing protein [Candidatus Pacearchaeota archaeon]
MNRAKLNFFVDFLAFFSFIVVAITGLIIFLFIPSGIRQGRYIEFLNIPKYIWSQIHEYAGLLMISLVIFHLILYLDWIKTMTKSFFIKKWVIN